MPYWSSERRCCSCPTHARRGPNNGALGPSVECTAAKQQFLDPSASPETYMLLPSSACYAIAGPPPYPFILLWGLAFCLCCVGRCQGVRLLLNGCYSGLTHDRLVALFYRCSAEWMIYCVWTPLNTILSRPQPQTLSRFVGVGQHLSVPCPPFRSVPRHAGCVAMAASTCGRSWPPGTLGAPLKQPGARKLWRTDDGMYTASKFR